MKRVDFEKIAMVFYPEKNEDYFTQKGIVRIDRNKMFRKHFADGLEQGYTMFRKATFRILAVIVAIMVITVLLFAISLMSIN